jgi:L-ascorbate metabolism protein UlaG (beta-lactamase superfamily)
MNKGGTQAVADIKATMVHAYRSWASPTATRSFMAAKPVATSWSSPTGVKIYHAGDTNVFGDMAIIRELYAPDIAMIPIGDHYTMSPREAAYACNLLKPKTVIPMHFGTFPVLTGRPGDLQKLVAGIEIVEMKPGVTLS